MDALHSGQLSCTNNQRLQQRLNPFHNLGNHRGIIDQKILACHETEPDIRKKEQAEFQSIFCGLGTGAFQSKFNNQ
jgi:hypothetical protein